MREIATRRGRGELLRRNQNNSRHMLHRHQTAKKVVGVTTFSMTNLYHKMIPPHGSRRYVVALGLEVRIAADAAILRMRTMNPPTARTLNNMGT